MSEQRLQNENVALREDVDRFSMFEEIIGSCEPMRQVLKQVTKVASPDSTVLILGEKNCFSMHGVRQMTL